MGIDFPCASVDPYIRDIMNLLKMTFALSLSITSIWMIKLFDGEILVVWGLVVAAILFNIYALMIGVVIDSAETMTRLIQAATDWGHMFGKLDDAAREAVAGKFKPVVRYVWSRGRIEEQFEDTGVEIGVFRKFLQESNKDTTASRRDWVTHDRTPAAYEAIYLWLVDHGHVIDDSSSGNQSYRWTTEWEFDRLMGRYWMAGRKVANMNIEVEQT
jgi:hypothetical protein